MVYKDGKVYYDNIPEWMQKSTFKEIEAGLEERKEHIEYLAKKFGGEI